MPGSNGGRYEVLCSSAIAQQIKTLQEQANAPGRGAPFLRALRSIARHLTYDLHDSKFSAQIDAHAGYMYGDDLCCSGARPVR
jgi:hypothetical protein